MTAKEMINKYNLPQTFDIKTAKALVYVGLIILGAYLTYFYIPTASFILILVLLFQKRWEIENRIIKLAVIATLLPLIMSLLFGSLQQLLIISFGGFSAVKSDIKIIFLNPTYDLAFKSLYILNLYLTWVAITITLLVLLLLNIIFPIKKKFFRVIVCLSFLIPLLASALITFIFGFANIWSFWGFLDYLNSGVDNTRELIFNKKIEDFYLRAYRTDYQGALGAFGVEVTQEKYLPFQLKFVRDISNYYHCGNVQIVVLNNQSVRIKPDMDDHETNRDLSLPKIFYLKPFYTTSFLNFLNKHSENKNV